MIESPLYISRFKLACKSEFIIIFLLINKMCPHGSLHIANFFLWGKIAPNVETKTAKQLLCSSQDEDHPACSSGKCKMLNFQLRVEQPFLMLILRLITGLDHL
jgi:hypothetical protein